MTEKSHKALATAPLPFSGKIASENIDSNRKKLESARKILADAAFRAKRRRHRRLFAALVAMADARIKALNDSRESAGP